MFETFSFVVLWMTVDKLSDFYMVLKNLYSTTFNFFFSFQIFQIVQCHFE
jgi:hypothetical protein